MSDPLKTLHLDLDGAWPADALGEQAGYLDARVWGPRLRYCAPGRQIEAFFRDMAPRLKPFVLTGSGDFHHLTALFLRKVRDPFVLVSFDNHPDWDVRPPRWSCGGWINRALELPALEKAAVWGCGNFELAWPARLWAPGRTLRSGRLEIHPWAEKFSPAACRRWNAITRQNWRGRFETFAETLRDKNIYVTIDLDALVADEACVNWENGLFTAPDLVWAIQCLKGRGRFVGGDLCGAWSRPQHERFFQKMAAWFDHPRTALTDSDRARKKNRALLESIWPVLVDQTIACSI